MNFFKKISQFLKNLENTLLMLTIRTCNFLLDEGLDKKGEWRHPSLAQNILLTCLLELIYVDAIVL